ncbi:MAG: hypothetical protein ACI4MG_00065 [Aristaeellaceae bacterium]
MSEKNRPRRGLLDGLADIVNDLYAENAALNARLAAELGADSPIPSALPVSESAAPGEAPSETPVYAARPALPPFAELWKTADEAIDWTEALASSTPTDGLTSPEQWALYHQYAASVLHGDLTAYLTVLKAANPMADLMPYVAALDVSTVNADELRATFHVRADLMEEEPHRYLSGMALRIARDLLAVLPVSRVTVIGQQEEKAMLTVQFERPALNKVRFAFVDPEAFVGECGGAFAEPIE